MPGLPSHTTGTPLIRCHTSARQALLDLAVSLDMSGMPKSAAIALRLAGRLASN